MRSVEWRTCVALAVAGLIAASTAAYAEDISGIISTTRTITQDSRLVGDVTCRVTGAPCIAFGAAHLTLRLNGFTMTGQADPVTACSGSLTRGEHGISTSNQTDATIQGPGTVQRFRATGVFFAGTLNGKVEGVTAATNCNSGIQVNAASSGIAVVANLATRNGASEAGFPCGGI
jgi:hypothetical protein